MDICCKTKLISIISKVGSNPYHMYRVLSCDWEKAWVNQGKTELEIQKDLSSLNTSFEKILSANEPEEI